MGAVGDVRSAYAMSGTIDRCLHSRKDATLPKWITKMVYYLNFKIHTEVQNKTKQHQEAHLEKKTDVTNTGTQHSHV